MRRAERRAIPSRALPFLFLATVWLGTPARAQAEPARVVLVRPAGAGEEAEETLRRAQAELRAAGFATVVVDGAPGEPPRDAARRADPTAVAVIAVRGGPTERAAEIWVRERRAGDVALDEAQVRADPHAASADVAIQSVELVRASLIEIEAPRPPPPPPPPDPPPPPRATAPPDEPRAGPGVGAGLVTLAGFDPATLHLAPGLAAWWTSSLGLGARVRWLGPTAGTEIEVPEGSASWSVWALTAGAVFERVVAERLLLRAGGDVGLLGVSAEGELAPPAESRGGSALDAAFLLGGAAGVVLSEHVAVTLGLELLISAPPPVVRIGGRDEGTVGRPWLSVPLQLELQL